MRLLPFALLALIGCGDNHHHVAGPAVEVAVHDTTVVRDTVWTRPPHGKPPKPRRTP